MKSLNDLACAAYSAHAKEIQRLIGVNSRPWVELPGHETKCWLAAVQQVLAEVATIGVDTSKLLPSIDAQSIMSTSSDPLPWIRDDQATFLSLCLVGGHHVPESAIRGWTDHQCMEAERWAHAVHFHASDNDDVQIPQMPPHVACWGGAPADQGMAEGVD